MPKARNTRRRVRQLAVFFETLGFEHVVARRVRRGDVHHHSTSLRGFYGADSSVTVNVGLHLFGMWMLDGNLRSMQHHNGM
jgi:hypothetical protein